MVRADSATRDRSSEWSSLHRSHAEPHFHVRGKLESLLERQTDRRSVIHALALKVQGRFCSAGSSSNQPQWWCLPPECPPECPPKWLPPLECPPKCPPPPEWPWPKLLPPPKFFGACPPPKWDPPERACFSEDLANPLPM